MNRLSPAQRPLLAGFLILMGVLVLLAGFGVGPMGRAGMNAPGWLVSLCGVFFICGGLLLTVEGTSLGTVIAPLAILAFATITGWIALFGDREGFSSGGLSFFTPETQVVTARLMFGAVSLLGFVILVFGTLSFFRTRRRGRRS